MNPCSGILRCMSLTYFAFKPSSLGQDEVLNCYLFIDNLCPGLLTQFKGESGI
jgi:hypothetical protein